MILHRAVLLLLAGVTCRAAAQIAPPTLPILVEAEQSWFSGGGIEAAPKASGKKLLGDGWGARAGHKWGATVPLAETADCDLTIRYGYDRVQFLERFPATRAPHAVRLRIDGKEIGGRINLPDTGDWRIFTPVAVHVGKLDAGVHEIVLSPDGEHNDLNLDMVMLDRAGNVQSGPFAEELPQRAGRFRIRLTPYVDRKSLSPEKIAHNLARQLDFHRRSLGFDPEKAGVLTVVSQDDWPDDAIAAWTNFGNVYLHEREVATPGGNYPHELFHHFESGLDHTTWWSEGVAFVISERSEAELYGRGEQVARQIAELQKWWDSEGKTKMIRDGVNVVRWWGSERVPTDARSGLYRATNLMMYRLWEREGDDFFRRFYTLIQDDRKAGRYRIPGAPFEERSRLILDYADRAAGHSLTGFWKEWKLQ